MIKKIIFYIAWLIVLFFAFRLIIISFGYFDFQTNHDFLLLKQHMLHNKLWLINFYIHLFFGMIAVLTGMLLFWKKLVHYQSNLHRQIGKLYIISILGFTGPTGFYLSFYAEGGMYASIGFILMSFVWILPTYIAYEKIKNKDIEGHYRWIIRSYCMTLAGVTLRLLVPLCAYLGIEEQTNFVVTAYACWMINLIIGECILFFQKDKNIENLIL